MLSKRLFTAAIGIPLVIYLLHTGGMFFSLAVAILAIAALFELNNMAKKNSAGIYAFSAMIPSVLMSVAAFYYNQPIFIFYIFTSAVLLILLEGVFRYNDEKWLNKNLYSILAVCYIGLFFSIFILLRHIDITPDLETSFGSMQQGEVFLWLALLGTWSSDTFAYFIGSAFGKNKLCPKISPNKSWEGAIAGFLGCVAVVWYAGENVFFVHNINLIIFGILIGFFAPLGDLAESQIKRFSGVKDSGSFFPGHGGVLDRLDSLLFVIPAVYIFINLTFR